MLLDLGLRVPIVGYTHGSHWDVTDTYRCAINVPRWGRHNSHTERHRNLPPEVLEAPTTITPEGTRSVVQSDRSGGRGGRGEAAVDTSHGVGLLDFMPR